MKSITYASILWLLATMVNVGAFAQCEETIERCKQHITQDYISDGQVRWVFLQQDEIAEFETILFAGNTYRISAFAGNGDGAIIFKLLGPDGNELFSNAEHSNAPYWDFKAEFSTLNVKIEAMLDPNKTSSACGVMLIGLKK
jgi:hypothetical protein